MAGIALGLASRPTYDAAEALLRNKQIEYQRELELKRQALQRKLAAQQAAMQALGMLNQNLQQQASQANQRAMQQEALQAQRGSFLERKFNQQFADWKNGIEAARKAGFQVKEKHQQELDRLEQRLIDIDMRIAAGDENVVTGTRAKMEILRQMAVFKPDVRVVTPLQRAQANVFRMLPNGQIVDPNDPNAPPPGPQDRIGTINEKGVFDPFPNPPAPKPDPAVVAQQKMVEAQRKEERRLTEKFITETERRLQERNNDVDETPKYDRQGAEARARETLAPSAEQFERDFGVPHPTLKQPAPPPSTSRLTPQQQSDLKQAQGLVQRYGDMPAGSNGPQHDQIMNWARRTVRELAPLEQAPANAPAAPQAQMPVENVNGQPLNDFGRYVLNGPGRLLDESTFQQSPIAQQMTFEEFDAARQQLESQVPKISTTSEAEQLPPGALFFNDRGDLLQNIPNPQPKPRRGPSPRGGGGGGGRPPQMAPRGSEQKKPPPPGRAQQPQQPPKKGMPLDRILGTDDGKDRRGNTPPRTKLILKKGDPNNKKLLDDIIAKLPAEQAKQLYVEEVDPSQPQGPNNRMDLVTEHDVRAFPFFVREEWDGKKYVKADVMIAPQTSEALSAFMKNGKNPPPPRGEMSHTYVILDRADESGAAEQWARIANQLTPSERARVTVFQIDSRLPDSPTNDLRVLGQLKIDPDRGMPVVVRGEWNGRQYALKSEAQGPKALESLRDMQSFRDFSRPDRDRHAEGVAKVAAEEAKALEDAKAAQVVRDTDERGRLASQFDKNVRNAGNPLGNMKVPAAGEAGYDNFKRAFDEWVASGGKSDGLSLDQHVQQREASAVNTPEKAQAILRAYNDPKNPLNAQNVAEARRIVERAESVQRPPTAAEREAAKAGQKVLDIQAAQNTVAKENPKFPIPRGQDKRLDAAKDLLRESGDPPKVTPQQVSAARAAVDVLKDRDRNLTDIEKSQLDGAKDLIRKAESPKNPTNPQRVSEAQAVMEKMQKGVPTGVDVQPSVVGGGPAASSSTRPPAAMKPYDATAVLNDIREIRERLKSSSPVDPDYTETLHQRVKSWADNTLNKGTTKIGGFDLIGDRPASSEDRDLAKDIKEASRFPTGIGVLQGLKQINEGRFNPVSVDAARQRLEQRIQRMLEQNAASQKLEQQSRQAEQQDRARQEQQRLTVPPTIQPRSTTAPPPPSVRPQPLPMQRPMSSLPPLQPSRTRQLKQGLATSVMKPGQLNLDEVNAGLAAMTGPQRVPYTGGVLDGMQKPPQQPSNQLGMGVEQFNPFGIPNTLGPAGGFITQPGAYFNQPFNGGYGSAGYEYPYDYGYVPAAPEFDYFGAYPAIEQGYGSGYDSGGAGFFENLYDMSDIGAFGPPGDFSPGPEIISEGYY